jgi:hypothetical protein
MQEIVKLTEEYKKELVTYTELHHQDSRVRIALQQSRSRLNRIKNEMRAYEMELLEPKVETDN